MNRANPPSFLILRQDLQDATHVLVRFGQGAVGDGEAVVLDGAGINALERCEGREVWQVGREFVCLGQVDEGANTGAEKGVELGGGGLGCPRVFAS